LETGALPIELHSCTDRRRRPIRAVSSIGHGRMARAKRLEGYHGDKLVNFRLVLSWRQGTFTIFAGAWRIFENALTRGVAANLVQLPKPDTMAVRGAVARTAFAPASLTRWALGTSGLPHRHRPNRKCRAQQCQKTEAQRVSTPVHRLPLPIRHHISAIPRRCNERHCSIRDF
jgi:hypothetical protein